MPRPPAAVSLVPLNLRVPVELRDALQAEADKRSAAAGMPAGTVSLSDLARMLLTDALARVAPAADAPKPKRGAKGEAQ